jgi:hypothetical protein
VRVGGVEQIFFATRPSIRFLAFDPQAGLALIWRKALGWTTTANLPG